MKYLNLKNSIKIIIILLLSSFISLTNASVAQESKNLYRKSNVAGWEPGRKLALEPKKTYQAILTSLLHTLVPVGTGVLTPDVTKPSLIDEGGTWLISELLIVYGVIIGPSAGTFYAGDPVGGIGDTFGRTDSLLLSPNYINSIKMVGRTFLIVSRINYFATGGKSVKVYNELHFKNLRVRVKPEIDFQSRNYGIGMKVQFN